MEFESLMNFSRKSYANDLLMRVIWYPWYQLSPISPFHLILLIDCNLLFQWRFLRQIFETESIFNINLHQIDLFLFVFFLFQLLKRLVPMQIIC